MRVLAHLGIAPDRTCVRSLEERCLASGLEPGTVVRMLDAFEAIREEAVDVCLELMSPGQLCDHVEQTHHARLRRELARLDSHLAEASHSGEDIDQLPEIRRLFRAFTDGFNRHLREEVEILFPLIRRLETDPAGKTAILRAIAEFLEKMEHDHNEADEALAALHELADEADAEGDGLSRLLRDAVTRLENAVQEQIYNENQILFPKALAFGRIR